MRLRAFAEETPRTLIGELSPKGQNGLTNFGISTPGRKSAKRITGDFTLADRRPPTFFAFSITRCADRFCRTACGRVAPSPEESWH